MTRILQTLDLFGQKIELSVHGRSTISTSYGGVLTILMTITLLILTYFIGKDIFFREHPNSYTQTFISSSFQNNSVNPETFPISFYVSNFASEDAYNEDYFEIIISHRVYRMGPNGQQSIVLEDKKLPLEKCTKANYPTLTDEEFTNSFLGLSFCINGNYSIYGYWSSEEMSYFNIVFKVCNQTTNPNCKSEEEVFQHIAQEKTVLVYNNIAVETALNNYTDPIIRYLSIPYLYAGKFFKLSEFRIQQDSIDTDAGLIFEDFTSQPFLTLYEETADFSDYSSADQILINFNFHSSQQTVKYYRSYIKIPDIIALTGGIVKFLMVIFQFINKPICKIEKFCTIINEINKQFFIEQREKDGGGKFDNLNKSSIPMISQNNPEQIILPLKYVDSQNANTNKNLKQNFNKKIDIRTPNSNVKQTDPFTNDQHFENKLFKYHFQKPPVINNVFNIKKNDDFTPLKLGFCDYIVILWRKLTNPRKESNYPLVKKFEDGKREMEIYFEYINLITIFKTLENYKLDALKRNNDISKLHNSNQNISQNIL